MAKVRAGLEVWLDAAADGSALSPGARVGLIAHPASIDACGRHALERIAADGRYVVDRVLVPEHGLFGIEQDMERVSSDAEPGTGLPIISLYGDDRESLRPSPEQVAGLDALVYDLQDVGSRYYTFVYTLSFLMEAARDASIPVIVLDRPNPVGGLHTEGPVLHSELASFVGRYPLPVRHGMTTGELALLFNQEFDIGCELQVVPMDGWRRPMRYEDTGLPWIPPSPNMPSVTTALVYPGGCLVEGTNLSEGRGTTTPFELVGAPWIDGDALARRLRDEALPGVCFRAAAFRPMFQKHAGEACRGVQVIPTDADAFRPFATYLALLREARGLAPDRFAWRSEVYEFETDRLAIDLLLGRKDLKPMLEAAASIDAMEQVWGEEHARFLDRRSRYLLYA